MVRVGRKPTWAQHAEVNVIIHTNAWHYKVWKLTHSMFEDSKVPNKVTVCGYVGRIFTMTIPAVLFILIRKAVYYLLIACALLCFAVAYIIVFAAGAGTLYLEDGDLKVASFSSLSIAGKLVPRWHIVCMTWVIAVGFLLAALFPSEMHHLAGMSKFAFGFMLPAMVTLGIVLYPIRRLLLWEPPSVFIQYIKDKRDGVCSLVTFAPPAPSRE